MHFFSSRLRPLTFALKSSAGKNSTGRTTVYHRGGAVKKFYRLLLRHYRFQEIPAYVLRFDYDPNRNLPLALLVFSNGYVAYVLKTFGTAVGSLLWSSSFWFSPLSGCSFPLKLFPVGSVAHSVESRPLSGSSYARSAGNFVKVFRQNARGRTLLRLSSGALSLVPSNCFGTYGRLANSRFKYEFLSKAGASRHLGRRPTVRGVAMNPVDHPHGGGQGKTSGGRPSVSPWGLLSKGKKTRSRSRPSKFLLKKL
jgi:large subunit ribosomal protein L2